MRNILLFILTLLITSCGDFLEQEPGTQTSNEELFSTYEGFELALAGVYTDLEDIATSQVHAVYADLTGGNVVFTPSSTSSSLGEISVSSNVENIYAFDDDADDSDLESLYDGAYDIINQANQIFDYLPGLTDATDDQISQLRAEALCARALSHFYLVRTYAQNYSYSTDASHLGIICNEEVQQVGVDYPSRKTADETYDFIIEDLETALTYFTDENILEGSWYSYFNEISCKALLARVALYATDYDRAIEYASDVIVNSGISLMSKEEYDNEWKESNTPISEIIFEFSAIKDNEGNYQTTNTMAGLYAYSDESDYEDYSASDDLLSLFDEGDVRLDSMFIEAELSTVVDYQVDLVDLPYYFTHKFQDNPGNPLLRLSELYLIRAEAYARQDDDKNALTDLNTIRERAGATLAEITDDLLDEIFLERRRELCFEGHLLYDIARFNKDVERNSGCISTLCNLSYPSNYLILPIPDDNIDLNSNLIQNEGY